MTAFFAVVGYGDGQVSLVRPCKPSDSLLQRPLDSETKGSLHIVASLEIASEARQLMVNADLDLVVALTSTAVHFLSLSSDGLTAIRSVALAADERVLSATWVPLKPRTLLVAATPEGRPWMLSTQTIFVAEAAAVTRRSVGNYSTRSTSLTSPARTSTAAVEMNARSGLGGFDASRRSPHTPNSSSTVSSSPAQRYMGQGSLAGVPGSVTKSGHGAAGCSASEPDAAVSPLHLESKLTSPTRELEHLLHLAAGRTSLEMKGSISCLAAAAHDPDLLGVFCLRTKTGAGGAVGAHGGRGSSEVSSEMQERGELALVDIRRGNILRKRPMMLVAVSIFFHPGGGLLLVLFSTGVVQILDMALQVNMSATDARTLRAAALGDVCHLPHNGQDAYAGSLLACTGGVSRGQFAGFCFAHRPCRPHSSASVVAPRPSCRAVDAPTRLQHHQCRFRAIRRARAGPRIGVGGWAEVGTGAQRGAWAAA